MWPYSTWKLLSAQRKKHKHGNAHHQVPRIFPSAYLLNRWWTFLNVYVKHRITCTIRQSMADDQDRTPANVIVFWRPYYGFPCPSSFPKSRDASNTTLHYRNRRQSSFASIHPTSPKSFRNLSSSTLTHDLKPIASQNWMALEWPAGWWLGFHHRMLWASATSNLTNKPGHLHIGGHGASIWAGKDARCHCAQRLHNTVKQPLPESIGSARRLQRSGGKQISFKTSAGSSFSSIAVAFTFATKVTVGTYTSPSRSWAASMSNSATAAGTAGKTLLYYSAHTP